MALTDIFTMVKADRYTQDGREEIIKAQETEVEDRTYNIGEISQKTGLMKTANGWVEPPKGKAKGAKTGAGKSPDKQVAKTESETTTIMAGNNKKTLNESMSDHLNKNIDAYKGYDQGQMEQLVLSPSNYEVKRSARIPSGGKSVTYSKPGDKSEITLFFDKDGELEMVDTSGAKTESKPSAPKALKLPDEKSSFQTDVNRMKKLKKEDYKQYTVQLEKLHSKYPINKWKDLLNKTTSDSAPRVLTGDCKIRIKK